MKHFGKKRGIRTRECSKCGGDLGDRYLVHAYCAKCHAEYMRKNRPKHSQLSEDARKKANCRAYTHVLIKRGKLKKEPCKVCGSEKSESHHEDYSKPREVIWLCREHHLIYHDSLKKSSPYSRGGSSS